jgi:hypothetical protein
VLVLALALVLVLVPVLVSVLVPVPAADDVGGDELDPEVVQRGAEVHPDPAGGPGHGPAGTSETGGIGLGVVAHALTVRPAPAPALPANADRSRRSLSVVPGYPRIAARAVGICGAARHAEPRVTPSRAPGRAAPR